jgi:Protein of unknown function (DUF3800)
MLANISWPGLGDSPNPSYPRYKLVLEAYFDDSGKQADSNFVCIAGFLADVSYWSQFVIDWEHSLLKHGINCIHMKDLMTRHGEFSDLTQDKINNIIDVFWEIIKKNKLIAFGIVVDSIYWNTLPKDFQWEHGNAQEFCFQRMLRRVRDRIALVGNKNYVHITFDRDMDLSKQRLTRFDNIVKKDNVARDLFVSICFANSKVYYQLQAADMLSWETKRFLEDKRINKHPTVGSTKIFSLGVDRDLEFAAAEYWDKEKFEKYIDKETWSLRGSIKA